MSWRPRVWFAVLAGKLQGQGFGAVPQSFAVLTTGTLPEPPAVDAVDDAEAVVAARSHSPQLSADFV